MTNVKSFAHQSGFIKFLAQGSKGVWLKIVTFRITVWWIKDDAGIPGGLKLYTKVKNIFYTQEFFLSNFDIQYASHGDGSYAFVKKSNQTKNINIVFNLYIINVFPLKYMYLAALSVFEFVIPSYTCILKYSLVLKTYSPFSRSVLADGNLMPSKKRDAHSNDTIF